MHQLKQRSKGRRGRGQVFCQVGEGEGGGPNREKKYREDRNRRTSLTKKRKKRELNCEEKAAFEEAVRKEGGEPSFWRPEPEGGGGDLCARF